MEGPEKKLNRRRRRRKKKKKECCVLFSEVGDVFGEVGDPSSSGRGGSGDTRPASASGRVEVSPRRPISPSMRSSRSSSVDDDLPIRHFTASQETAPRKPWSVESNSG